MLKIRTIEQAIQDMREKSKIPLEEVVNQTGVAESTLYRKCSPSDPEVQFKVTEIVPVMRAFNRFDPLEVIARSCGFLLIKPPLGRIKFEETLADYHKEFSDLFGLLLDFMQKPTKNKIREIDTACSRHMQQTASIRAAAQKNVGQFRFEFDGDNE